MEGTEPDFTLTVHQNEYLSVHDRVMRAALVVRALPAPEARRPQAAQVLLVDCSGSMGYPATKMRAARRAADAAIDALRDGSLFAVVAGTGQARPVYPTDGTMARADARTRAEAHRANRAGLYDQGGTRIGTWLTAAGALLDGHPTAIRHALLLTDGHDEHESAEELDRVLGACAGRFTCDARGVGDDWKVDELRRIVTVLRGRAEALDENELEDDFRSLTVALMGKVVADLRLRVRLPAGSRLRHLKQTFPTASDLTEHPLGEHEDVVEFSTGAWAAPEARDYQLAIELDGPDGPVDDERLAATVAVATVVPGTTDAVPAGPPAPVVVRWTDDPGLSHWIRGEIAVQDQHELLEAAVTAGCVAYGEGRFDEAASAWGEAVRLATALGNDEVLERLRRGVEVLDAATGEVRVRPDLSRATLLWIAVGSDRSSVPLESGTADSPAFRPTGPDQQCPNCPRVNRGGVDCCEACGHPFTGGPEATAP
jgi:hypothetical protein